MKKHFLLSILMLLPFMAKAMVQVDGIFYELNSESKTATVTHFSYKNDYSGDVVIPESITFENQTYIVTSIGSCAFSNCGALNSVFIPKTIKYIGSCAFEHSKSLKAVYISDLEAWCKIKFDGSQDANPLYIAHHLYLNGEEIHDLEIPSSISSINDFAFQGCSNISSVKIPNSVTSIGMDAFLRCGLTSVIIPESVTTIGAQAFYGCSLLTSVTFPESVNSVEYGAFEETPWFSGLPDGFVYLGKMFLMYTNLEIKEGTKGIASNAFSGCSGLSSVKIPNSVVSIGTSAFCGCTGLKTIVIPESVKKFDQAFIGCTGLTSVILPKNITSLGIGTFSGCTGLTSFEIPEKVTTIGEWTFSGCSGFTSFEIPETITTIELGAFQGCTGLKSIILPNSIDSLGYFAFMECSSLTSVILPNGLKTLHGQLFQGCPLTSITIPESVNMLENDVFNSMNMETMKILAKTPPTVFEDTFRNYDLTLMVPKGSRETYLAAMYWKNFKEIVEFEEDTGINNLSINDKESNCFYDLKGEIVKYPRKGLYIVKGKKVILK